MKTYNIYKTENLINGRSYWGVHDSIDENDGYLGSGKILLHAIKKYGKDSFKRKTMVIYETAEAAYFDEGLLVTEEYILSNPLCYNIKPGGCGGAGKHSEETKLKMRKSRSEEHRRNISIARTGTTLSEETKRKMRKPKSDEMKRKLSCFHKGTHLSEETKRKIRDTLKKKSLALASEI